MLDHMLFNKVPWFNVNQSDNEIKANGIRYVAFPPTVTVKEDYAFDSNLPGGSNGYSKENKVKWMTDSTYNDGMSSAFQFFKGETATCIGAEGDYWVVKDITNHQSNKADGLCCGAVKKDLFIANWGG